MSLSEKHLDDGLLLAHLDGELNRWQHARAERHLKVCWRCRSRAAQFEEQIRDLTEARNTQAYPSPGAVDQARREFFARFDQLTAASGRPAPKLMIPTHRVWGPAVAVVVVAAGVAALMIAPDLVRRRSAPSPAEVLAGVQGFEGGLRQGSELLHQSFEVEIVQTAPQRVQHGSKLEIWADASGERYSSRWQDAAGTVRYAVWRPAAGREFRYDPAVAPAVLPAGDSSSRKVAFVELWRYGLDAEKIEAGLLDWLRGRQWQLVSFSTDFRAFASGDGVVLRALRVPSEAGQPAIRLTARRNSGGLAVRVEMEVDPASSRPRLLLVAFDSAGHSVTVRLVADRMEGLPASPWRSVGFEPDIPSPARTARERTAPLPVLRKPAMESVPAAPALGPEALDSIEIEARYVLHRLRACLGEPVRIERTSTEVRIAGIAETLERKRQILAAFADLRLRARVEVDIQTVDEAASRSHTWPHPPAASSGAEPVHFGGARLPVEDHLVRYFRERAGAKGADARVTQLSNEALTLSTAVLEEAWALRRLAERYPPAESRKLRPESRRLLAILVQDHLEALAGRIAAARNLLAPVLSAIGAQDRSLPSSQVEAAIPWDAAVLNLFQGARRIYDLVHGLFGGGDPGQVDGAKPEQMTGDLLAVLAEADAGARRMEARAILGFSATGEFAASPTRRD